MDVEVGVSAGMLPSMKLLANLSASNFATSVAETGLEPDALLSTGLGNAISGLVVLPQRQGLQWERRCRPI